MTKLFDNWYVVDISTLVPAEWNYKEDDAEMDAKLRANIERNGVVQNLITRVLRGKKLEVVNGNHRLRILKEMGLKKVVVYHKGKISLNEAKRLAVETNETNYETNQLKLSELMRDISLDFGVDQLVLTMPYEPDVLNAMLEVPGFDINQYAATPPPEPPVVIGEGTTPAPEPQAPPVDPTGKNKTIMLTVPAKVHDAFMAEVDRFNSLLNPDMDPERLNPTAAIKEMVKILKKVKSLE